MKLNVRHIGKETRTRFEKVHPVLNEGDRMKASLKNYIERGLKGKALKAKKK